MLTLVTLSLFVSSQSAAADQLARIQAAYDDVNCDVVQTETGVLLAEGVATRDEAHEALFRAAACHVVNGNLSEASRYFARIMRENPEAKPAFAVEPRVSILIEAARGDEEKRRKQEHLDRRQKIVDTLKFTVDEPAPTTGGTRASFVVHLKEDPTNAVRSMRLSFHKDNEAEIYALPLRRAGDGLWRGEIPGTYTRTPDPVVMLWFLTLSDEHGDVLTSWGTREKPHTLLIASGTVLTDLKASERFPPASRVAFASAGALGVSTVFFVAGTAVAQAVTGDTIDGAGARLLFATMQVGLGTVGMYTATFSLIDGWQQILPTAVTLGVGGLYLGLLAVDADQRPIYVDQGRLTNPTALVPLAGAMILGAATATTLVLLDDAE